MEYASNEVFMQSTLGLGQFSQSHWFLAIAA